MRPFRVAPCLASIVLALALSGCVGDGVQADPTLQALPCDAGLRNLGAPIGIQIRNQTDFGNWYAEHCWPTGPGSFAVDFSDQMVLAFYAGDDARDHVVTIVSYATNATAATVTIEDQAPSPDCLPQNTSDRSLAVAAVRPARDSVRWEIHHSTAVCIQTGSG